MHLLVQLVQLVVGQPSQNLDDIGAPPAIEESASAANGTSWTSEAWDFIPDIAKQAAAVFIPILIALLIARIIRARLRTMADRFDERSRGIRAAAFRAIARSITFALFAGGVAIAVGYLTTSEMVSEQIGEIATTITSVLFICAVGFIGYCLVDVVDAWLAGLAAKTASKLDDMLVPLVRTSLRMTVVIVTFLQVAQAVAGAQITTILAGFGIGAMAIGLAAQDTIKNFFGSLMLFSDRPFEMGDRITVDGHDGPVENVGFRSTRIRTLDGHLVTIPNGELANKTIRNIGKRPFIRRSMNLGVTYDTPPEKIQRAMEIVRETLDNHEGMNPEYPPRVFFNEFNDSSLNIFAMYWHFPADWWAFCALNERVNFEILRRFNEEGIEFAFPTQTLFLAGDPNRPLASEGRSGMPGV